MLGSAKIALMKLPRFSTTTLLLGIAAFAISCVGFLDLYEMESAYRQPFSLTDTIAAYLDESAFWLPLILLAFAVGRKALTLRSVAVYAIAQLACMAFRHLVLFRGI
jgi:hypothetical protein